MLLAGLVVEQRFALQRVLDGFARKLAVFRRCRCKFQDVERGAGVAVGVGGNLPE